MSIRSRGGSTRVNPEGYQCGLSSKAVRFFKGIVEVFPEGGECCYAD